MCQHAECIDADDETYCARDCDAIPNPETMSARERLVFQPWYDSMEAHLEGFASGRLDRWVLQVRTVDSTRICVKAVRDEESFNEILFHVVAQRGNGAMMEIGKGDFYRFLCDAVAAAYHTADDI